MANKNLKKRGRPFEKGNPGGPGRPIGSVSIIGRIKKIFEEDPEHFENYVQDVLRDPQLRREIIQQIDGKPAQPLSNLDGTPFVIQVMKYGDDNSTPQLPT